jgi:hypothetical protein
MANENVTQLKPAAKTKLAHRLKIIIRKDRKATRAIARQTATAIGVGSVAIVLIALSLSHLAHGIAIITGAHGWHSWAMAIGIDLGFIALEFAQLATISENVRQIVKRFALPAIWGTLAGSAAMNAFAFAAQAGNAYMMAAAIALGVAIPALIYALTRVGAALYIDCHSRG